jgi:hypothetical protein
MWFQKKEYYNYSNGFKTGWELLSVLTSITTTTTTTTTTTATTTTTSSTLM